MYKNHKDKEKSMNNYIQELVKENRILKDKLLSK